MAHFSSGEASGCRIRRLSRRVLATLAMLVLLVAIAGSRGEEPGRGGSGATLSLNPRPLPPGAIARLGTARRLHGPPIEAVEVVAQGRYLIVRGGDGSAALWQLPRTVPEWKEGRAREVAVVAPPDQGTALLGVAPDGQVAAWRDDEGRAAILDLATLRPIARLPRLDGTIQILEFSADSSRLAVGTDSGQVLFWELRRSEAIGRYNAQAPLTRLAVAPDGKTLAAGAADGSFHVWEAAGGRELAAARRHQAAIVELVFSPGAAALASLDESGMAIRWEISPRVVPVRSIQVPSGMTTARLTADGEGLIAADPGGKGRRWDLETGRATSLKFDGWLGEKPADDENPKGPKIPIRIVLSPRGTTLAAFREGDILRLWSLFSGAKRSNAQDLLARSRGSDPSIASCAFSPDERFLAVHLGSTIKLLDALAGGMRMELKIPQRGHHGAITALSFLSEGKELATGGSDQTVRTWHVPEKKDEETRERLILQHDPGTRPISSVQERLEDHVLISRTLTDSKDLRVHSSRSRKPWEEGVLDAAALVRLWNPGDGSLLRTVGWNQGDHNLVWSSQAVSPDGRLAAVACQGIVIRGEGLSTLSRGEIRLRDLRSDKIVHILNHIGLRDEPDHSPYVTTSLAFSPDGKRLAAGNDSTHLWDVDRGVEIKEFHSYDFHVSSETNVSALAFATDGSRLAALIRTVNTQARNPLTLHSVEVLVWDIESGKLEQICPPPTSSGVTALALSTNDRLLASATGKTIRLWRLHPRARDEEHSLVQVSDRIDPGKAIARLDGHEAAITTLALSRQLADPLGSEDQDRDSPGHFMLASGDAVGTVCLWDAESRSLIRRIAGHRGPVRSVAFTLDRTQVVSAGEDSSIRLWDARDGRPVRVFEGSQGAVRSVAIRPDGNQIASGGDDGEVRLWERATGKELSHFKVPGGHGPISSIAYLREGRTVATRGSDAVYLWDLSGLPGAASPTTLSDSEILHPPAKEKNKDKEDDVAEEEVPQPRTNPFGFPSRRTRASDLPHPVAGEPAPGTLGVGQPANALNVLAVASDDRLLAASRGDEILVWEPAARQMRYRFQRHDHDRLAGRITALVFPSRGDYVISGNEDGSIRFWTTAPKEDYPGERLRLAGDEDWAKGIRFSPDGQTLATWGDGDTPCLWPVLGSNPEAFRSLAPAKPVRPYQDDRDPTLGFRQASPRVLLVGHTDAVTCGAFSPDGRLFATGSLDRTVRIWEVASGRALTTFTGHADGVLTLAFSPDGCRLASSSADATALVWDLAPWTQPGPAPGEPEKQQRPDTGIKATR